MGARQCWKEPEAGHFSAEGYPVAPSRFWRGGCREEGEQSQWNSLMQTALVQPVCAITAAGDNEAILGLRGGCTTSPNGMLNEVMADAGPMMWEDRHSPISNSTLAAAADTVNR